MYALDANDERIRNQPTEPNSDFKETEVEVGWAVVTGILDHHQVQEWARKDFQVPRPPGDPVYCRVDLQRQTLQKDGTWSGWKPVNIKANLRILDNMPEVEAERTPEDFRVSNLVDPLPHLTIGSWTGVDVESFVRARVRARRKASEKPGVGMMGGAMRQPRRAKRSSRKMVETGGARQSRTAKPTFESRPPVLMLRTLDFNVEPGQTYRYRSRVVVFNLKRRQGENRLKFGPWSPSTEIVTIPFP